MDETFLQLGAGRFLRAFVDRFVYQANEEGQNVGQVVVVQRSSGPRQELLNKPDGYNVLVRGYENGETVDRIEPVKSISRCLVASNEWDEVLNVAGSPSLRYLVTNSTEAGFALDSGDARDSRPPQSMPGKVTQLLWKRFETGGEPLVLLPCELIEQNATKLRELVTSQATSWGAPAEFITWFRDKCSWLNNLVDCIVTSPPEDHPAQADCAGLIQAEPYMLWAIERTDPMPPLFKHPAIQVVDQLDSYYLRKVRILNGLHTAMVSKFHPGPFETVKRVMKDDDAYRWLHGMLWEEIVPTIAYRVPGVAEFAEATLDRLRNPFVEHRLSDIALNQEAKVQVRLIPTRDEYVTLFGKQPVRLCEACSEPNESERSQLSHDN